MPYEKIDFWAELDATWRGCFLLAWESFQGGSIPVGAILVDGAGNHVSAGRNRRNERIDQEGQVAGSNIAHAEINALASLTPGHYSDYTLFTTLEPCLLCSAALRFSHVGTVQFAANDPMWSGVDQIPELSQHIARRWTRRIGPLSGPLQTWGALLPLISSVERGVRSVIECHAQVMPETLDLAQRLAGPSADRLRSMTLEEALGTLWDDLAADPIIPTGCRTGEGPRLR